MGPVDIDIFFYSLLSVLLAIVAYFLKQLHTDFKRVEKDVTEVKTTTAIIKTEFKGIKELMNQRIESLKKRLNNVESFIFNNK